MLTPSAVSGYAHGVDPLYAEFGRRVKAARLDAGLTQARLAEAIGLTRTSVANIEAGRQRTLLEAAYRIADAVGRTPHSLLPEPAALRSQARLPAAVEQQTPDVRQWIINLVDAEEASTDEQTRARGASGS